MTYAVFDGMFLEVEATGQSRVSCELLRAAVGRVGPGFPVERLAIATCTGRLHPNYTVEGFPIIKMGGTPRRDVRGTFLFPWYNAASRIHPRPDAVCWITPDRFARDVDGLRQVVIVHDFAILRRPHAYPWRYRWMQKASLRRMRNSSCHVSAVSEATKRDVVDFGGIDPDRITVVHNGVGAEFRPIDDAGRLAEAAGRLGLSDKRFMLFVGKPGDPRKNIAGLMQIFLDVRRSLRGPFYLVMVGPGGCRDIDRICQPLGYTQQERSAVLLLGRIPNEDLVAVYNLAVALVFPTLYEGFGLPVLEAMACGAPVVSSDCSSIPEITGDAAVLLDPARTNGWADAVRMVLDDRPRRDEMIRRGLARARTMTWERSVETLLGILAGRGEPQEQAGGATLEGTAE